ncbi:MAG: hypothetical protein IBX52_03150 [Bacterioplanes sp.]|nr:hypothetical protein [Bacterioplanes sp.]
MIAYFLIGMVLSALLCLGVYALLQQRVNNEQLSLDDGKGYLLVSCIVVGFIVASAGFYIGQVLGYDRQEHTSTMMALAILLNIMVTMLSLIFGLVKFREPERY